MWLAFDWPVYVFANRQSLQNLLMAIHRLTCVMGQFVRLLIALDANMGLHFDNLDPLASAKALHNVAYSTVKNAQVL